MSCPLSALASIAALTTTSPIGGIQISPPQPMAMDTGEVPLYNPSPDISAPANAHTAKKSGAKKHKSKKVDAKAKKQSVKKHKLKQTNYQSVLDTKTKCSSSSSTMKMKRADEVKSDQSNQKANKPYNKTAKMTTSCSTLKKPSSDKRSPPREAKSNRPFEKATTTTAAASLMRATNYGTTPYRPSFPVVLMGIISAPQNSEYITFLSDEQRIIIVQPDAVAQKVLPMYFEEDDHTPTYNDFLRLFKVWGFEVMNDPQYPQVNVYKHPQFRKGDWEACLNINMAMDENNEPRKQGASLQEGPIVRQRPPSPVNAKQASPARTQAQAPLARLQARAEAPLAGEESFRSPQTNARSVTPPENVLPSLARGVDEPYRAHSQSLPQQELASRGWNEPQDPASPGWNGPQEPASSGVWNGNGPKSMTQDPALSRGWTNQSSSLERMIAATAETRRSLYGPSTGFPCLEELAAKYPAEARDFFTVMAGAQWAVQSRRSLPVMPPRSGNMGGMDTTSITRSPQEGLTDAQVDFMTRDVVSQAMATLQGIKQQRQWAPQPAPMPSHHISDELLDQLRRTIDDVVPRSSPGSSNNGCNSAGNSIPCTLSPSSILDAMTESFIERSNARRIRSRPAGIMGTTTAQFT
eukprot:CAMPEP_0181138560 /NCGR_PEP_ID=MMETSP1071-20121207/34312_1 /TAXON_ID=35127 /ORGANISM="Thalassiosira sp., Strain NH16" /LENGTH=636 /DNA_ID=CAMNT_0023225405 /DNA_START=27 /DNA_END=1934 /DNA_ORIENTATION=+